MKYTMSITSGLVASHLIVLGFADIQPSIFTGVLGVLVVINWIIWLAERERKLVEIAVSGFVQYVWEQDPVDGTALDGYVNEYLSQLNKEGKE